LSDTKSTRVATSLHTSTDAEEATHIEQAENSHGPIDDAVPTQTADADDQSAVLVDDVENETQMQQDNQPEDRKYREEASLPSEEEVPTVNEEWQDTSEGVPGDYGDLVVLEGKQGVSDRTDEEQEREPDAGPRRKFWPPTREQVLTGIAFWSVILLGTVLRFWGLGDKPLHHDESMHAYFSMASVLRNTMESWLACFKPQNADACYSYNPLLHGPFQFHGIAFVYLISEWLSKLGLPIPDGGVNNTTARILAATLGSATVALPYLVRRYLGTVGAWVACFLLAISPGLVYFSRFTREDAYMAFFTLLLVVCLVRYVNSRQMKWLIWAAIAFVLSYATKEATFLTVAVFGSFFGAVLLWELGSRYPIREQVAEGAALRNFLPKTAAPVFLICYFAVAGVAARFFFAWLHASSEYIADPSTKPVADAFVSQLKYYTTMAIPVLGIVLGLFVIYKLVRELWTSEGEAPSRRGLARLINPRSQPWLDTFLTMPWVHWFFALMCGWGIFVLLFSALFTKLSSGIADGIWQGVYYWLEQQQVARGGQPWYYYLMLIPLYEQIGVIFGIVGIVRCLVQPTRFRLFLVYWFLGNFFIYSWAAEKMPWLMIHMTMPLMLLAAIGLEPAARRVFEAGKWAVSALRENWMTRRRTIPLEQRPALPGLVGAGVTVLLALLLLVPTLQNMYQVTYINPAEAGYEMMIYVQTSEDVKVVMDKVEKLDNLLYQGKHDLSIGVTSSASWPFVWYLRDYHHVCYNFLVNQTVCNNPDVIISAGEDMGPVRAQYGDAYNYQQYRMRVQWDQGYMMPKCEKTATDPCTDPQPYIGVGPLLWLSYGDDPPKDAKFDFGKAAVRVWRWWFFREPFGDPNGSFDMDLLIRKDLPVSPSK
jgi:uncharacterized protein (TIGR03663 family)